MLEKYSVLWKTHRGRIYTTPLFNAVTSLTIVCENKQKAWSPLHTLPINHWNTELRVWDPDGAKELWIQDCHLLLERRTLAETRYEGYFSIAKIENVHESALLQ